MVLVKVVAPVIEHYFIFEDESTIHTEHCAINLFFVQMLAFEDRIKKFTVSFLLYDGVFPYK